MFTENAFEFCKLLQQIVGRQKELLNRIDVPSTREDSSVGQHRISRRLEFNAKRTRYKSKKLSCIVYSEINGRNKLRKPVNQQLKCQTRFKLRNILEMYIITSTYVSFCKI